MEVNNLTTFLTNNVIMIDVLKSNRLDASPYVNSLTMPILLNTLKLLYIVATLIFGKSGESA